MKMNMNMFIWVHRWWLVYIERSSFLSLPLLPFVLCFVSGLRT
jgi:hypothetical protein